MRTTNQHTDPAQHTSDPRRSEGHPDTTQAVRERPLVDAREPELRRPQQDRHDGAPISRAPVPSGGLSAARERQREEFGGFNIGAAFFGWLVAVGLGVMLTAIAAAAGTALGLVESVDRDTVANSSTIGTAGAIVITAIGFVAYFCGGYVAGRMSRFDGMRQGFGVWMFGLLITAIISVAGAILGDRYNLLGGLNLPRIPIDEGTLATAGAITLIAVAFTTLLGALIGGVAGETYNQRVDRVAIETDDRAVISS